MSVKNAFTDHPINPLLAERWSPYGFAERPVSSLDLCSLFEAARWAPSSYNEQPWHFMLATKSNPQEYDKLLSCLVEANQVWAKAAPVLALGLINKRFKRNNAENSKASHDLGLAVGNLLVEATARGIYVHQMGGILPDKAREIYQLPPEIEAWTGIAIGYKAEPEQIDQKLRELDAAPRQRKPITDFVFSGMWGLTSAITRKP